MAIGTPYVVGQGQASLATLAFTPASATGAGDTLACWVTSSNATFNIQGVSDDINGAWQAAPPSSGAVNGQWFFMSSGRVLGTLDSVTVTWTNTGGTRSAFVIGIPGAFPAPDQFPTPSTGTSTAPSATSGVLQAAGEIVLEGVINSNAGGAPAWASPWTQLGTTNHSGSGAFSAIAYQMPLSTSSVSGGPTIVSANWCAAMLTLFPVPAPGTPYVMCQGHGSGSFNFTQSVGTANGAGDTLFAWVSNSSGTINSVSDPVNGSWLPASNPAALSTGQTGQWFTIPDSAVLSPGTVITAHFSGSSSNKTLSVFGCANLSGGIDASPPASDHTGTAQSCSSGPMGAASELVIAAQLSQNSGGVPAWSVPFTQLGTNQQNGTSVLSSFAYDIVSSPAAVTAAATLPTSAEAGISVLTLPAMGMVFYDDQAAAADAISVNTGSPVAISLADAAGAADAEAVVIAPAVADAAGASEHLSVSGNLIIRFTPPAPSPVTTGETAHEVTALPLFLPPASPVFIRSQMPVMYLQNLLTGQWVHRDVDNVTQPLVTWNLNAAGTFTCTLSPPVSSLLDASGNPLLDIWQTACYLEEAGEIKFGGILTQMDPAGPALSLTFTEFSGYANGMPYEGPVISKTDYEALDAVRYIWSWLQSQTAGNLGLVLDQQESGVMIGKTRPLSNETRLASDAQAGDKKITIVPLAAGQGGPSSWTKRAVIQVGNTLGVVTGATDTTISLASALASFQPKGSIVGLISAATPYVLAWYNSTDCGQEIASIQAEAVFDFYEQHSWTDSSKQHVAHQLSFGVPRIGAFKSGLRFAEGENIVVPAQGSRPGPNSPYANNVVGMGAGQGSATVRSASTVPDGRLKRTLVYQDQTITNKDRLASRVAVVAASVQHPDTITSITVVNHPNATFGSFQQGDDIMVTLASGWRNTQLKSRIISISQDPTTQLITLGLARSDSFTYAVASGSAGTV